MICRQRLRCHVDESDAVDTSVWYVDDGDGYGDTPPIRPVNNPVPNGLGKHCDDLRNDISPQDEDTIDNNCDGLIDDVLRGCPNVYADTDKDGFETPSPRTSCSVLEGYVADSQDCDDTDSTLNPNTFWYEDADKTPTAIRSRQAKPRSLRDIEIRPIVTIRTGPSIQALPNCVTISTTTVMDCSMMPPPQMRKHGMQTLMEMVLAHRQFSA